MWGGLRRPSGPFQVICVLVAAVLAADFSSSSTLAQQKGPGPGRRPIPDKPNLGALGDRINSNTIAIVSGNINATYLTIAYHLSAVLDDGDNFRVMPVIGGGGGQNSRDGLFLKGVDRGITQSIVLNTARRTNELGPRAEKLVYIVKLGNED